MKISAVFADGSKMQIDGWTYAPTTPLTANDTEITISYTAFGQTWTVKQGITIKAFNPVLAENSWTRINEASTSGQASSIWNVGDTKDIVVDGETLTVAIMGFNHDDLESGGKAGITFGLKELMKNLIQLNGHESNAGGYPDTSVFSFLEVVAREKMPSDLRAVLKNIIKKTSVGSKNNVIGTEVVKLFLFSEIEVFGSIIFSLAGEGSQYSYFTNTGNRIKRTANGTGTEGRWWERSPVLESFTDFCIVIENGEAHHAESVSARGVCFGFCV